MTNILLLCNVDLSQKWGDYSRVFSLMEAFQNLGHYVHILIIRPERKTPNISNFLEKGIEVTEIHPPKLIITSGKRGVSKYLNYASCYPSIQKIGSKIIQDKKIDYIYSYMPGVGSSVPAMRLKSKHKIKFILDAADLHSFVRPKFLIKKSFNNAEKILAITESIKNDLVNRGIDKNKIHIIPNGADFEFFNSKNHDKKSIDIIRKSFESNNVVMFSGSLQDLNILINAASIVIKKIPDVKFVIIGDRRDPKRSKSYWENQVQKIGLSSHFLFLGKKPRDEIPKYLLSSDVCVDCFPDDPYYAAAHPIKILEYGACEKPVVATNVTETKKIVKHGEFGYVSDSKKPKEYAEFLINLLSSKTQSKKMGKQFRIFIQENFDWMKIAKKLELTLVN